MQRHRRGRRRNGRRERVPSLRARRRRPTTRCPQADLSRADSTMEWQSPDCRKPQSGPERRSKRLASWEAFLGNYAKAPAFAPVTISSTTLAAPTMVMPAASCSSVMPRGLVQAPQSQTLPLLATN